jgi:hypothetical protein
MHLFAPTLEYPLGDRTETNGSRSGDEILLPNLPIRAAMSNCKHRRRLNRNVIIPGKSC